MDVEGEGNEGPREEETMVGKEGSVLMGFKVLNMKIPWRREKLLTPVFWPGEFHGLYSPGDHKESDTTE